MNIIDYIILISLGFTVLYLIVVAQTVVLSRLLRSRAWGLLAAAFVVGGFRQLWGLARLPATLIKAQAAGQLPENLTTDQWITLLLAFVSMLLLILGFDHLRRDLRKIGI